MNPEQQHNNNSYRHDTLPAPVEPVAVASAGRQGFPPLGTTLPTYAPPMSGVPGSPVAAARPLDAQTPPKKHTNWKKRIKRTFIVLLIVGLLAGGYIGGKVLINAGRSFDGNLFGLLQNDKLLGEDEGRVNVLLAGNSSDDPGHSGGDLTDSMMIVSMDTVNNTAFMLSIPRDLYIDVPGNGYSKINEVYQDGNNDKFSESGYPAGGMGLLTKVVERDFGLDIHYYALVNYAALREAVNAVDGIDVTIASSDRRGLYDAMISRAEGGPLRLANGPQHLDGQTALNLARARGSGISYGFPQSDFNRSEHQRLMLVALKDKATSAGVVSNPIKLGSLLDSFGNNVQTDFQTTELRRLVDLAQKVPSDKITSVSLNNVETAAGPENLLMSYRTRLGQSALVPAAGLDDFSEIAAYLRQLMAPPAPATPAAQQ